MKYTTAVLALAAVACAAPAEVEPRDNSCPNTSTVACCNTPAIVGITLLCQVLPVGKTCSAYAYCCKNGASTGGLINVDLANCAQLL